MPKAEPAACPEPSPRARPGKAGALTLQGILRGSAHALTIFKREAVAKLETELFLKRGKPYLKCYATGKDRPAKPEEIVRQLYVKKLMDDYGYPSDRVAVEKPVQFGSAVHEKAADIAVIDKDDPKAYCAEIKRRAEDSKKKKRAKRYK